MWQLTQTVPERMRLASLWAMLRSRVQMLEARPKTVLLASARDAVEVAVGEGLGADDGAEDLFLDDLHLGRGFGEHRGLDKVAVVAGGVAAGEDLCALLDARLDVAGDAVELLVADQRAHLGGGVHAGTDLDLASDLADAFDDLVVDPLVDHEARSGAAALALVEEDGAGGSGDGFVEIGVGEDDGRDSCRRVRG